MKSKTLFAATLLAVVLTAARAAELAIEDIQLKNAPAFAVIGVEPSSVEKPTSARRFAMNVAGMASGGEAGNIAIETAPYWWTGGKGVTFEDYYEGQDVLQNAVRSFTLSLATKDTKIAAPKGDSSGSSLGVGFRTRLWIGSLSEDARLAKQKFKAAAEDWAAKTRHDNDDLGNVPLDGHAPDTRDPKDDAMATALAPQIKALRDAVKNPMGFELELAGAVGFESETDTLSSPKWKRWGAWLNASYRPRTGASSLDFVGTVRYLRTKLASDDFDNFDVGARVVWAVPQQPVSVSAEYVQRFRGQALDNTRRFALIAEYALSDTMSLYVTNGKDFAKDGGTARETFTFVGVNFSIAKPGAVKLP